MANLSFGTTKQTDEKLSGKKKLHHGYEGETNEAGERHGFGILRLEDGSVYSGQWKLGRRSGKGTANYSDGSCYVGEWEDNVTQGQGLYSFADGAK